MCIGSDSDEGAPTAAHRRQTPRKQIDALPIASKTKHAVKTHKKIYKRETQENTGREHKQDL